MSAVFAKDSSNAIPIFVVDAEQWDEWCANQPTIVTQWANLHGFTARWGKSLVVPNNHGGISCVIAGFGTKEQRQRGRFAMAAVAGALPAGTYKFSGEQPLDFDLPVECFGWLMSQYCFDRYKVAAASGAQLVAPQGVDISQVEARVSGEWLTRDLINTPAEDMGPAQLEMAIHKLAQTFNADLDVIEGDDLLDKNFPLIHTVGRAASRTPRLLDMKWGNTGPTLTLVGKGVCFDTGGLNLKPGSSMGLMKKDMGGAANVLGLAQMIMTLGLNLRLRVLIPAVENAVSGSAFRPGDVFPSRKGLTVEINNTDAEGRLVLADALAYAQEDKPDLIISMATLTGAARVAVGADLAPYYTDDENDAKTLTDAATRHADPVWRMPFHTPYETQIEPEIADLDNAPAGGFAGSITAALFLRRFVGDARYMHFDIYGWNKSTLPARSAGGVGQGTRALLQAIPQMLKVSS